MSENILYAKVALMNRVRDSITLIEYTIDQTISEEERYYLLGKKDAFEQLIVSSYRSIFKGIKECNDELQEINSEDELFNLNKMYLKGYKEGCIKLLSLKDDVKKDSKQIKLVCYVQNQTLSLIIGKILDSYGFTRDPNLLDDKSYFLSDSIETLNTYEDIDITRFAFLMKRNHSKVNLPKEIRNDVKELIGELGMPKDDFVSMDKIFSQITNLNDFWYHSHYVYLDSTITAENLAASMIKGIKLK